MKTDTIELHINDLAEYDGAADYCAVRGLSGDVGTPLPDCMSPSVVAAINADIESFMERVKQFKYARAMFYPTKFCGNCGAIIAHNDTSCEHCLATDFEN